MISIIIEIIQIFSLEILLLCKRWSGLQICNGVWVFGAISIVFMEIGVQWWEWQTTTIIMLLIGDQESLSFKLMDIEDTIISALEYY